MIVTAARSVLGNGHVQEREQQRRGATPAHDSHAGPQRSRRASPSRRHRSFFQFERKTREELIACFFQSFLA